MRSHFKFSKEQRDGIFLLLLLIIVSQCVYFFIDLPSKDIALDQKQLESFQNEIYALRAAEVENRKPKIYPFNPNFITDYKGYALGMTNTEIDRLLQYRGQNKWINSAKEFQKVTLVSNAFLKKVSPYFKFPEWVTNPKPKTAFVYNNIATPKSYNEKIDLNTATENQLRKINGIGEKLSERIITYRDKFEGGFIADVQLQDVYGLSPEVVERTLNAFTVKTPRQITKFHLNSVTIDELVTIQHIDYELAYEITDQRTLRDGYRSLEDLEKVKGFPVNKIEIIKLYLTLD